MSTNTSRMTPPSNHDSSDRWLTLLILVLLPQARPSSYVLLLIYSQRRVARRLRCCRREITRSRGHRQGIWDIFPRVVLVDIERRRLSGRRDSSVDRRLKARTFVQSSQLYTGAAERVGVFGPARFSPGLRRRS